jgi:hypothetical protein
MIIVTGFPRTGTSMVMQSINRLGIGTFGYEFPPSREAANNPKGFWEHSDTLSGNVASFSGNIAIKVILRKFLEYSVADLANDTKIVLCRRPFDAAATSQMATDSGNSTHARCVRNMGIWYGRFDDWAATAPNPIHTVQFSEMRATPRANLEALKTFIAALLPVDDAVDNIEVQP